MVSLAMSKSRFNPEDMSVKETDFVRDTFQVEPDVYCKVKDHVFDNILTKAKEEGMKDARAWARAQLRDEVKKELTDEVMPQLKAAAVKEGEAAALEKARKELEPKIRADLMGKVKEEWSREQLTEGDREAYAAALRDVEVESLMFATSSSEEADRAQSKTSWKSRVRQIPFFAALVGAGPFAVWLLSSRDWHSVAFWLTALPYLVVSAYCAVIALVRSKSDVDDEQLRKHSSEYMQIVSRARIVRHLFLSTKVRKEVQEELDSLLRRKNDLDGKYKPSVRLIEEVKPQVKARLADEMDPEKLFAEEFEDRLKTEEKVG